MYSVVFLAHYFKLTVLLSITDGIRAVSKGTRQLYPAEGARLERKGPPPAAVHCCFTLSAVFERAHHSLGEVFIWLNKNHCTKSDEFE